MQRPRHFRVFGCSFGIPCSRSWIRASLTHLRALQDELPVSFNCQRLYPAPEICCLRQVYLVDIPWHIKFEEQLASISPASSEGFFVPWKRSDPES